MLGHSRASSLMVALIGCACEEAWPLLVDEPLRAASASMSTLLSLHVAAMSLPTLESSPLSCASCIFLVVFSSPAVQVASWASTSSCVPSKEQ